MNNDDILHPKLGLLKYNSRYGFYEGKISFQEVSVSISFIIGDKNNIESILNKVSTFVEQLDVHVETTKDYAVENLLELKNKTWSDEDEEPLTPQQFKSRMILESIDILSEGDVVFYYDDGDLFFGHCILITMDSSGSCIDAGIAG